MKTGKDIEFENINDAQLHFYGELLSAGEKISTRGMGTLELFPVYFSVRNPRARVTTLKGRNWKFAPALGELTWHLSGSKDVDFISKYLSNWKNFSEDKIHITGSCYGFKMFEKDAEGSSRWKDIVNLLKKDPSSRRAVISLLDPSDEINDHRLDISCTISLQFLIRNGKLDIIVNMRSNDLVWGLPYDFFLFSYLQEFMAVELNVPVGIYHHCAASLHIYERHFDLAERILRDNGRGTEFIMPDAPDANFQDFVRLEKELRTNGMDLEQLSALDIDGYWKELLKILYYHHNKTADMNGEHFKASSIYGQLI